MRYFFAVFFLCSISLCSGQSGNYFLSHYSPGQDRLDNVCFQMAQHDNGTIYYATRSGVLQFDGRSWKTVAGEGAVYTLYVSDKGQIFWGGITGFGQIVFNSQGQPELSKLSDRATNIFQSAFLDGHLFFINDESIFDLDIEKHTASPVQYSGVDGSLTGVFEVAGNIYFTTTDEKTYRLDGNKVIPATLAPAGSLVFSAYYEGNHLTGFSNNEIYLFSKGKSPRRIVLEDQEYIDRSVVVHGTWVSSELIVLGTLRGGLIFINVSNGKTYEIVNNTKGLPDNEIFTLFSDRSFAVWAAHEFGFTRIVPYLPFRSFNHYTGLQGNLLCAITYENSVFVGTSLGLYRLDKEDVYEEISYYADAPVKGKSEVKSDESDLSSQVESKKRGFFGLFRRKRGSEKAADSKADEAKPSPKSTKQKILKKERIFRTSNFVYRKVNGIEAKVTQLVEVKGKLVAAGLGGTFEINGLNSKLLVEAPSRYLFGTRDGVLFVSTYSDKVHILNYTGDKWTSEDFLVNVNDQINHILESSEGDVWLCSLEKFYQAKMVAGKVSDIRIVPIDNPNYDELVGVAVEKDLVFANSQGFFHYNRNENSFNRIDSLSGDSFTSYFANGKSLWYRDEHGWKVFGKDRENRNAGLLNLFRNVRFLLPDKKTGDLWIITGENELFKFYNDRVTPYSSGFPLILKSVRNGSLVQQAKRLDVHSMRENNAVTIEVVQPDYLAAMAVEYRYHLRGLDKNWSGWSPSNNLIEIPYLPPGDYMLEVESRNIFGETKRMQEIALNIIPPYWKQPWFYAFEVILLSLLVVLSFRLSIRYRIVSRLLMLLTIIILIQLIETLVAETLETKTSPVIDFIMQVAIAMLILPVEGFLRERMLRSLEVGDRFYKFILPKEKIAHNDNS